MPRLNVTHLKAKLKMRARKHAGAKPCPYTASDALIEDRRRANRVRLTIKKLAKADQKPAKRLAKLLRYKKKPPETPASAPFLLDQRERLVDHLVRLSWKLPEGQIFTAALIPRDSRRSSLANLDSFRWMKCLRQDLTRAGGRRVDGWVCAGIHGEHNPDTNLYDIHYHVVICGTEMRGVVDSLRARGKYKLADISGASSDQTHTPPIWIRTVKLDELRYALSYAAQTWWPSRRRGRHACGKSWAGMRERLKGVSHAEWLLWMHRQKPQHLYLLFNLEVGKRGLVATRPLKFCTPVGGCCAG